MILENRLVLGTEEWAAESVNEKLRAIVCEHARLVYQIAFSVLRNRQDAEDVTQEVFLRVIRKQSSLDEIRDQQAWLARITWRLALTRRKRTRRARFEPPDRLFQFRVSGTDPEQIASSREMISVVEGLIEALPEKLSGPLLLSTVHGISSNEIGEILNIPQATVRTRIARARRILERKVSALMGGEDGA